jgi:hypothetical protein
MSNPSEKPSAVVEHIILNSGVVELPLLTKTNYHEWSMVMQVPLEAMELWDIVESANDCAKDRRALATILHTMPSEMKVGLIVKKSVKEACEVVRSMRVSDDRMKSASLQCLMKEYENITFHYGNSIDDFTMRINMLVASVRELGEELEDSRVVRKILRVRR